MIRGEGRREGEGTLLAQRLTQVGRPTNWIDTQMVKDPSNIRFVLNVKRRVVCDDLAGS